MSYSETNERKRTYVATDIANTHVSPVKEPKQDYLNGAIKQTGAGDEEHISNTKHTCEINVLIVDDHALIREGLRQLFGLEEYIHVVGEAANGFEAIEKVHQLS